ncbi:MAG TPA: hypothetical protein VNP73_11685 [Actinomycetota bacterium]|nr:hypothetical protein [Actinomycetota bacterium]
MAAAKKPPLCSECGAVLTTGPARCPLCGTEPSQSKPAAKKSQVYDRDKYQAAIRDLRKKLKEIRDEGAEAV